MSATKSNQDYLYRPSTIINKAVNRGYPHFKKNAQDSWTDPFYFIQAADTQLGLIMNYGDGTIEDQYPNVTWDKELELCRQTVQIINSLQPPPKFFVLCGDLLDAPPDQWPEVRKRQLEDFIQVFQGLKPSIPMVSLCGNADLANSLSEASVDEYKSTFGDDYFAFWVGNVHFIALNSQLFEDVPEMSDMALAQNQWLDDQLELSKARQSKHIVIFQHIPLFVDDTQEEESYFNIKLKTRMDLLAKFKRYGVSKIFSGHCHKNAGGWDETLEIVVTTAIGCQLGEDVHGMRIVKVFENEIIHEFHGLDTFPQEIDLKPRSFA